MTNLFKAWVCIGITLGIDPVEGSNYFTHVNNIIAVGFAVAGVIYCWMARPWKESTAEDRQVQP